jgi:prepilin-type N-terminal cleavage/methylation domain-containing protein
MYFRVILAPPRVKRRDGHTLPEVLVTITVIGILAAITIPSYFAIVDRARCLNFGSFKAANQRCLLDATITNPSNGGTVFVESEFNGTFKNLPTGTTMWIYVYAPGEGKFYLDQVTNFNHLTRTWKLENVSIGEINDDISATYKVGIFIADVEGSVELRDEEDGRDSLPSGKKLNEIEVTRK